MELRPYQQEAVDAIDKLWKAGHRNVLEVQPTGAGKTIIVAAIAKANGGHACLMAHRRELVSQMSMALCAYDIRHNIILPNTLLSRICKEQQYRFGKVFYSPSASTHVASVDTLVRAANKPSAGWVRKITLWVQDEAHHVLEANKWGKVISMFPGARGLGVTATPLRTDGKGLGREYEGVFDALHVGPSPRGLMEAGYLCEYRACGVSSDLDLSGVKVTASGDYSPQGLETSVRKSRIVGDVVDNYLERAPGKLGVTFVNSIETAKALSEEYNSRGVSAAAISSKTPDSERGTILGKFKSKQLMQLVNVDILGEGFDLPNIEVISLARPTMSYGLFVQQVGRGLRLSIDDCEANDWDSYSEDERKSIISLSQKPHAIIIDHVGSFWRHGRPDLPKDWSLAGSKDRGQLKDSEPLRICNNMECLLPYPRYRTSCPYCADKPQAMPRAAPVVVAGSLVEMELTTRKDLLAKKAGIDGPPPPLLRSSVLIRLSVQKRHRERQESQDKLRSAMEWWAFAQTNIGNTIEEAKRLFVTRFNTDILSAQCLGRKDADSLAINIKLSIESVVAKHKLEGIHYEK